MPAGTIGRILLIIIYRLNVQIIYARKLSTHDKALSRRVPLPLTVRLRLRIRKTVYVLIVCPQSALIVLRRYGDADRMHPAVCSFPGHRKYRRYPVKPYCIHGQVIGVFPYAVFPVSPRAFPLIVPDVLTRSVRACVPSAEHISVPCVCSRYAFIYVRVVCHRDRCHIGNSGAPIKAYRVCACLCLRRICHVMGRHVKAQLPAVRRALSAPRDPVIPLRGNRGY